MKTTKVLETYISNTTISEVAQILTSSSKNLVAICNTNTVVRSLKNEMLRETLNSFNIKTPDGFPIAKALSIINREKQERVDGYKVFLETIQEGLKHDTKHYFFGNNEETVQLMIKNIKEKFPNIKIEGYLCPDVLSSSELVSLYKETLSKTNANILWISLGFPKQELFMYELVNTAEVNSNLVGVGGVFNWVAGTKKKAPEWIANLGLEWALRLVQEPKRLYKRYLIDNTLFIYYFFKQLLNKK